MEINCLLCQVFAPMQSHSALVTALGGAPVIPGLLVKEQCRPKVPTQGQIAGSLRARAETQVCV